MRTVGISFEREEFTEVKKSTENQKITLPVWPKWRSAVDRSGFSDFWTNLALRQRDVQFVLPELLIQFFGKNCFPNLFNNL